MADLKTRYMGLEMKNPLVASASTLSKKLTNIKKMGDAGIACVVLYSLFEEEITHESLALDYFLSPNHTEIMKNSGQISSASSE